MLRVATPRIKKRSIGKRRAATESNLTLAAANAMPTISAASNLNLVTTPLPAYVLTRGRTKELTFLDTLRGAADKTNRASIKHLYKNKSEGQRNPEDGCGESNALSSHGGRGSSFESDSGLC